MTIPITGGAGFIGANFVLDWLTQSDESVINLDKLAYAGNLESLASLEGDARHIFVQGDIGDSELVDSLLAQPRPCAVLNFAAESHVDRSIYSSGDFIQTNIVGNHSFCASDVRYSQAAISKARRLLGNAPTHRPAGCAAEAMLLHVTHSSVQAAL